MGTIKQEWKPSGLQVEEQVDFPKEFFVFTKDRLIASRYLGETNTFMMFEHEFQPSWGAKGESPKKYRRDVSFASIYCGAVKIIRKETGELIRAERLEEGYAV